MVKLKTTMSWETTKTTTTTSTPPWWSPPLMVTLTLLSSVFHDPAVSGTGSALPGTSCFRGMGEATWTITEDIVHSGGGDSRREVTLGSRTAGRLYSGGVGPSGGRISQVPWLWRYVAGRRQPCTPEGRNVAWEGQTAWRDRRWGCIAWSGCGCARLKKNVLNVKTL